MKEAFEVKVTEKGEDGFPEIVLNNERTIEVIDNLISYIFDSGFVYMPTDFSEAAEDTELQMFSDGFGVFLTANLGDAETLRAMNDDFGILPYPKYDSIRQTTIRPRTTTCRFSRFRSTRPTPR